MTNLLRKADERIFERMAEIRRPVLDKIMVLFTYAGTGAGIWWMCLVIPFLITRRFRETGAILIVSLAVNCLLGEIIIKKLVRRDRPSTRVSNENMKIKKPKDHSFPSGHSASSFCAFMVTAWCCPVWVWLPALVIASMIAFSRIYLRVHYLTDVLGGIMLGLLDGSLVTLLFKLAVFRH